MAAPPIVKRYLIFLNRYKWFGAICFLAVVGAAGFVAVKPTAPPKYSASGVLTSNELPVFSATGTQIQQSGVASIGNEDTLLSGSIVQAVAERIRVKPEDVIKNTLVKADSGGGGKGASAPTAVRIIVTYTDVKRDRTLKAVQALLEGMVEQSRLNNTAKLRTIIDRINQQLPRVLAGLRAAEQRLERYDREQGAKLVAAQTGSLVQSIASSQQQQRQLALQLGGLEAQMASLQRKLGLSPDQAYVSSALSADPIINNLRSQIYQAESQMATLRQDLRPEHPKMVELANQKRAYERLLTDRANEVIGGNGIAAPFTSGTRIRRDASLDPSRQQLANTLVSLQAQRDTLKRQLDMSVRSEKELRYQYTTIPNLQLERDRLEQQVKTRRDFYNTLQSKLTDAQAAEIETVTSLRIVEPPKLGKPIVEEKKPALILAIGGLIGLVVAGGVVFLMGSMEGVCYTTEDLRAILRDREVVLLGLIPAMDPDLLGNGEMEPATTEAMEDWLPIVLSSDSVYAEFYERFRTNLRRPGEKMPKVLVFTSVIDAEGKTVSAYNLAIASARAGKRTLLVEADLRSASQAGVLQIAPDPYSVIEPLRYYGQTADSIRLVPEVQNLYIVPSPGPQRQSAAILESDEFIRMLEDARIRFDMVILDTPPLSAGNDVLLLEDYIDGVIVVTRPGISRSSLLGEGLDQLAESDLNLIGAIINGAEITIKQVRRDTEIESVAAVEVEEFTAEQGTRVPTGVSEG